MTNHDFPNSYDKNIFFLIIMPKHVCVVFQTTKDPSIFLWLFLSCYECMFVGTYLHIDYLYYTNTNESMS